MKTKRSNDVKKRLEKVQKERKERGTNPFFTASSNWDVWWDRR